MFQIISNYRDQWKNYASGTKKKKNPKELLVKMWEMLDKADMRGSLTVSLLFYLAENLSCGIQENFAFQTELLS